MARRIGMAALVTLLTTTAACDDDSYQSYKDKRAQEQQRVGQGDKALLSDLAEASLEFSRRLRQRLTIQDGVWLISETYSPQFSTLYAFPASSPWSITCGPVGLNVTFGAGSSEGGGIMDVELSQASLNREQCKVLVPYLARDMTALTRFQPVSPRQTNR
jgi:hypothetical protein